MNDNFTNSDQLIRYLDGELSMGEADMTREKIQSDPAIAAELEKLRLTREAVKIYGLKQTISAVHIDMMKALQPTATVRQIGFRQIARYSASIAAGLLIVLGSIFLYQYFSATTQSLYRNADNGFQLRETRSTQTSALENAYKRGDDLAVINTFATINNPSAEDYFLRGNAALHIGNALLAIQSFTMQQQKNSQDNTHFFEEDAQYFLALAYLRNNEPAKALPVFRQINASPDHGYHSKVGNWFIRKLARVARH